MTVTVANTANTDYVYVGRTRQNEIAHALTTKVVTVDSNAATGNAHVNGAIQAGALHVNVISGGVVGTPNTLTVNTTVTFTGTRTNLGPGANVIVTTGNSTHRVLTVNSSNGFTLSATKVTMADHSDANVTAPANNDVLVYSSAESAFKNSPASGLSVANAAYAANADKLDGQDASYFANNTHVHAFDDLTGKPTTAQGYGLSEVNLGNSTVNSVSTNTSLSVSDTVGNTVVSSNGVTVSNSTVTTTMTTSVITVGNSTVTVGANSTALSVGNSSQSVVMTQNGVTLSNSTVSFTITRPDASQVTAGNYFIGANGTWQQATSNLTSNTQTFTANGTWTKPAGYSDGSLVRIRLWGGGGSGAGYAQGGGGGGGAFHEIWKALSELGATEAVTVGNGGAAKISAGAGNDGGDSSFGSHATAYGGKGGTPSGSSDYNGGGGGGIASKGSTTGNGGGPGGGEVGTGTPNSTYGGGAGGDYSSDPSGDSYWGGGGGGAGNSGAGVANGGDSVWGGGGGAGGVYPMFTGGTSVYGGAGGNSQSASGVENHTAGTAPGGGGAGYWNANGKGKAGARGEVHVTVFP